MKDAMVYSSRTGNTAQLAQRLKSMFSSDELVYYGPPADQAAQADILFVGSWTDKGTCSPEVIQFLASLQKKQVYLFGTAGFGGSPAYFAQIGGGMAQNLPSGNTLLGYYLCQGKMPHSVRARYEAMAQADPQKAQPMLDNFDRALAHPNGEDLDGLEKAVSQLLKKYS